jgi:hypothetical protein
MDTANERDAGGASRFEDGALKRAEELAKPGTPIGHDQAGVNDLLKALESVRDLSDSGRFLQGGLLARLREGERWRTVAPGMNFGEFCEDYVGIKHRAALMLIQINDRLLALGIDPAEQRGHWTKMRVIVRVATTEDIALWLDRAKTMTTAELQQAVTRAKRARGQEDAKDKGGADYSSEDIKDVRSEGISFRLTVAESANVRTGIETASVMLGSAENPAPRGAALDLIVTEWGVNRLDSKERALDWHVRNLERVYGVKLRVEK